MKRFHTFYAEEGSGGQGGGGATILSDAAKGSEGGQQQQQQAPSASGGGTAQRPDYVPEKFWDATKGAPDIQKLGSAYVSLEQAFSKKGALTPPLPGDPQEKHDAFTAELRKLTGAPEKPEGYEIKAPEKMPEGIKWDEEGAGKLAAIAHKHGMSKAAVQEILGLQQERMGIMASSAMKTLEQRQAEGRVELEKEWGKENFATNAQAAVKAAQALGVDMADPDLGNNPKVIQAMYKASLLMREDKMIGRGEGGSKTNAEAIEEIRRGDAYNGKLGVDAQRSAAERMAVLSGVSFSQKGW